MTPLAWFFEALWLAALVVEVWAFIDAMRRPTAAFPAAGKQTKPLWLIILGVATVIGLASVAYSAYAAVDLPDRRLRRGRHLPGRRAAQGQGVQERRDESRGPTAPGRQRRPGHPGMPAPGRGQ